MTIPDEVNEIIRVLTGIASLGAAVMGVINSRKIKEVHISLNSRLEKMLQLQGEASEAKGAADERANPFVPKN